MFEHGRVPHPAAPSTKSPSGAALADSRVGQPDEGDLVGRLERQKDRERRSLAERALDGDLAAVKLDEPTREREAEARAFGSDAVRLWELLEFAEQPGQI